MDDIIKIEPNELRTEMQKLRAEGYDLCVYSPEWTGEKKDWE